MGRTARNIGKPGAPKCTVQESRFVIEYLKDGNGVRSVIDSGSCPTGDKIKAAHTSVLFLKRPHVLAAIKEQLEASAAKTLITVDRILQEVYRGAVYNVAEAFNPDGTCKPMSEMSEDLQRSIEGFEVEEVRGRAGTFITKYKFSKKSASQQILLDRLENLVKRFEVTGANGVPLHSSSKVDLSDVSKELLMRIVEQGDKK